MLLFACLGAVLFVYLAVFKPNKPRRANFSINNLPNHAELYNSDRSDYLIQIQDIIPITAKRITTQNSDIIAQPNSTTSQLPPSTSSTTTKSKDPADLLYVAVNDASGNRTLYQINNSPNPQLPTLRLGDLMIHHIAKSGYSTVPSNTSQLSTSQSTSKSNSTNPSKSLKPSHSRRGSAPYLDPNAIVHIEPAQDTNIASSGKYCLVFFPTQSQQFLCQSCPPSSQQPNSSQSTSNSSTMMLTQHNTLNTSAPCRSGLCLGHGFSLRSGNRRIPVGLPLTQCIPTKSDLTNPHSTITTSHFALFDPTIAPFSTLSSTKALKPSKPPTSTSNSQPSSILNIVRGGLITTSNQPIYEIFIEEDTEWALINAQLNIPTGSNHSTQIDSNSSTTSTAPPPSLPLPITLISDEELQTASREALQHHYKQLAQAYNQISPSDHPNSSQSASAPALSAQQHAELLQLQQFQRDARKKEKSSKVQIDDLTRQVGELHENSQHLRAEFSKNEMTLVESLRANDALQKEVRDLRVKTQRVASLQERSDKLTDIEAENEQLKFKLGNLTRDKEELLKKLNEKKEKERLKLEAQAPPGQPSGSADIAVVTPVEPQQQQPQQQPQQHHFQVSPPVHPVSPTPAQHHQAPFHQFNNAASQGHIITTVSTSHSSSQSVKDSKQHQQSHNATIDTHDKHDKAPASNKKNANATQDKGDKSAIKDHKEDDKARPQSKDDKARSQPKDAKKNTGSDKNQDKGGDKNDKNAAKDDKSGSKTPIKATIVVASAISNDSPAPANAKDSKKGKNGANDNAAKDNIVNAAAVVAAAAAVLKQAGKRTTNEKPDTASTTATAATTRGDKNDKSVVQKAERGDGKQDKNEKSDPKAEKGGDKSTPKSKDTKDAEKDVSNQPVPAKDSKVEDKKGSQKGKEADGDKSDKSDGKRGQKNEPKSGSDGKKEPSSANNVNVNNRKNQQQQQQTNSNILQPVHAAPSNPSSRQSVTTIASSTTTSSTNPPYYEPSLDYNGQIVLNPGDNFTDYSSSNYNTNTGYQQYNNNNRIQQEHQLQQQQQQQLLWQQQQQQQQQQQLLWQQQQLIFYRLQNEPNTITPTEFAYAQQTLHQEQQQAMLLQQILLQQQQSGQPLNPEYLELVRSYSTRFTQLQFYTQYIQHQELLQKQHELRQRELEIQQQIELQQLQFQQQAHLQQIHPNTSYPQDFSTQQQPQHQQPHFEPNTSTNSTPTPNGTSVLSSGGTNVTSDGVTNSSTGIARFASNPSTPTLGSGAPGINDIDPHNMSNTSGYVNNQNNQIHPSSPTLLNPTLSTTGSSRSGFVYNPSLQQQQQQQQHGLHQDSPAMLSLSSSPSHGVPGTANNHAGFNLTPSIHNTNASGPKNISTPGHSSMDPMNNPFHPANTEFMSAFQPLTPTPTINKPTHDNPIDGQHIATPITPVPTTVAAGYGYPQLRSHDVDFDYLGGTSVNVNGNNDSNTLVIISPPPGSVSTTTNGDPNATASSTQPSPVDSILGMLGTNFLPQPPTSTTSTQ